MVQYLVDYQWEGNIREVENFVKYIISTTGNDIVKVSEIPDHFKIPDKEAIHTSSISDEQMFADVHLSSPATGSFFDGYSWETLEKDYVTYLLNKNKWSITRAALEAQVNRSTFNSRMKKLGIHKG
jgi:transcriptional regulator of acetoin/glycerol metabolism